MPTAVILRTEVSAPFSQYGVIGTILNGRICSILCEKIKLNIPPMQRSDDLRWYVGSICTFSFSKVGKGQYLHIYCHLP